MKGNTLMIWGNFTLTHILSLVAAAALVAALYVVLKNASQKVQLAVLGVLSFSGIAAIIYNLVTWGVPLEYLPLHLCSLNALLLPVVVFTRNKTMGNLLLLWSLGALVALILNYDMAEAKLFDAPFCFYYFPHVLEFGIPILLFKLGLVEKDVRCIGSTIVITMVSYTLIHFVNVALNSHYAAIGSETVANYMFSVQPSNPLLALFYALIPFEYWYMYMVIPVVAVYLLAVYAPQLLAKYRKKA